MSEEKKSPENIKALAVQKLLKTENGKTLYEALMEFTKADCDVVPRDTSGAIDPLNVMYNQGRRSVMIYIDELSNKETDKPRQEKAEIR